MLSANSKSFRIAYAGTIAIALALSGGTALAGPDTGLAQNAPQHAKFSDGQLHAYAKSAIQVAKINQAAEQSMQSAKSDQEKQQLYAKTQAQQVQVVKNNGLSVQQYNAIALAERSDPQLHAKVVDYAKQYGTH